MIFLSVFIFTTILLIYLLYKFHKLKLQKDDIDLIYLDDKKMYVLYIYGNNNVSKYEISSIYIKYFGLGDIIETYEKVFNYVFEDDRIVKIEVCESEKYNDEKVIKTIYY